jgi:hypothetical protein
LILLSKQRVLIRISLFLHIDQAVLVAVNVIEHGYSAQRAALNRGSAKKIICSSVADASPMTSHKFFLNSATQAFVCRHQQWPRAATGNGHYHS